MNSKIFWGKVWHRRHTPMRHDFSYAIFTLALDLDELPHLKRYFPLLGINRFALFSIWEDNYLGAGGTSLKQRLFDKAASRINLAHDSKVILITMPRLLGYVFNPVSFFLVIDSQKSVSALVTEVSNTFGETHLYFSEPIERHSDGTNVFSFLKEFFVSPFLDVSGSYRLSVKPYADLLDVHVALSQNTGAKEAATVFEARLSGRGRTLSLASILATLMRYPITAALSMTKIHFEALRLYFLRKVSVYKLPQPLNADTIKSSRCPIHRARLLVLSFTKQEETSLVNKSI